LTRYLLDSNVVMYWLNGREPAPALLAELSSRGDHLAVNAVSVAETYSGIPPEDLEWVDFLLGAFEYWPLDRVVARLAGEYRYKYAQEHRKLPAADVLLGAHAISEDATLITNNERDFPMPELKILIFRDWKPGGA
jgi:tRNA(fMet)-specific endonuclease VapC